MALAAVSTLRSAMHPTFQWLQEISVKSKWVQSLYYIYGNGYSFFHLKIYVCTKPDVQRAYTNIEDSMECVGDSECRVHSQCQRDFSESYIQRKRNIFVYSTMIRLVGGEFSIFTAIWTFLCCLANKLWTFSTHIAIQLFILKRNLRIIQSKCNSDEF